MTPEALELLKVLCITIGWLFTLICVTLMVGAYLEGNRKRKKIKRGKLNEVTI